jgi:hypothetical protein
MGAENGLQFVEEHTDAAAFAVWREGGEIVERTTGNFPEPLRTQ